MIATLRQDLTRLMITVGLSGHEERVAADIRSELDKLGQASSVDRLGNVITTFQGDPGLPSAMLFTHMDQLGFFVRKIEADGLIRVERMGGVSERAMAAQAVTLCIQPGYDVNGIIINKAHHATSVDDKYKVLTAPEIHIDVGCSSKSAVEAFGIKIGTPVVYRPQVIELAKNRIAGTSVDDRAGCAVLLSVARQLIKSPANCTVHLVWSVQEEFNLRGAVVAAQMLNPDIAMQIDLMQATDTPDMADRGDMVLGKGPGMSLYSFHGRGTLNGTIPHPAMVNLLETAAKNARIHLQRSAQVGVLTDLSYVQTVGRGIASIDIGFPMRYSHSTIECCDLGDLRDLTYLTVEALKMVTTDLKLERG